MSGVSPEDGALATVDVGLAYRDDTLSEWTEMAHSLEQRKLKCNFTTTKVRRVVSCLVWAYWRKLMFDLGNLSVVW